MQLHQAASFSKRPTSDALILPFWHEGKKAEPACQMGEFRSLYSLAVHSGDFKGKEGERLVLYVKSKHEHRLFLLGLGKKSECTEESIRRAYGDALKECRQKKLTELSVALPQVAFSAAYPAVEGLLLANYAFEHLKSKTEISWVTKICLIGVSAEKLKECHRAQTVVKGVNFAQDLINGNADDVTPQMLAKTAKALEKESKKITTTVLDQKALEKLGMGLLLAVNRASSQEPVLILVHYRGNPGSSDLTALVGKGITYDTGGLILKPKGSMETMKCDMSGAATVLGVVKTAAALTLKVNLIAVIPSTENAIGSRSYKPGDVYKSYSGKMVEIADTDAEGRLVLADAISYVQDHFKPRRIIDLATLTGGVVVALGEEVAGLFCNDDRLSKALMAAGNRTYERLWQLPLFKEYREALKSHIADIKNAADRKASPITGAIFIQEFVHPKTLWAHLDIAGTAYKNPRHYHTTDATGFGVRLLIDYLLHRETENYTKLG